MNAPDYRNRLLRFSREGHEPLSKAWNDRIGRPVLKRIAVTAIIGGMKVAPIQRLALTASLGGYPSDIERVIGSGGQQFVYLPESQESAVPHVKKVLVGTSNSSETETREISNSYSRRFETLAEHMGSFALDTTYGVSRLSGTGKWAVVASQRYLLDAVDVTVGEAVDYDALNLVHDRTQITNFVDLARGYTEATGSMVDVQGTGNLSVDAGDLVLVDTIEQTPDEVAFIRPNDTMTKADIINRQLDLLAAAS